MRKILAVLFWLLPIMCISGCISDLSFLPFFGPQTTQYENDVIVIKSLQALPAKVAPGQSTKIVAWVENRGSTKIDDVKVELYDWCEGTWSLTSNKENTISLLPKETKQIEWMLTASKGIKFATTCPEGGFKIKATYNYTTTSYSTIEFIDYTEMQARLSAGTYRPSPGALTLGFGPVKPILTTQEQQPIPVDPKNRQPFTAILTIENRGSGFVKDNTISTDNINFSTTSQRSDAENITKKLNECKKKWGENKIIRLIQERTSLLVCENITPLNFQQPTISMSITTNVSYEYEFRAQVPVTIEPAI
ncbi:MAG: hypothetical protein QXP39_02895 [Candidatus Aenigmatarchaeota archaeon]